MSHWIALSMIVSALVPAFAFAEADCAGEKVDLLVLGDSQTGGYWSSSYFGDFFQKCMSKHASAMSFAVYARGGTQPIHWVSSDRLDHIPTVFRDMNHARSNIGSVEVPVCKKRLDSLFKIHQPRKVLFVFGDNLVSATPQQIETQYLDMVQLVIKAGILPENCYLLLPTYEMQVEKVRHVPQKNLFNTLKVNTAVKAAMSGKCQILDGLDAMKSSVLLVGEVLKRVGVEGTTGCFGAAADDNIHYCGEAARELAEKACDWIR